jgi:hypothetical protein
LADVERCDWYVLKGNRPVGPASARELALLLLQRRLEAGDLVWCEGLPGWLPIGAALGAAERGGPRDPAGRDPRIDAAQAAAAAGRVVSLSQLYVEKLAEQRAMPPPVPGAFARAASAPSRNSAASPSAGTIPTWTARGVRPAAAELPVTGQLVAVPDVPPTEHSIARDAARTLMDSVAALVGAAAAQSAPGEIVSHEGQSGQPLIAFDPHLADAIPHLGTAR